MAGLMWIAAFAGPLIYRETPRHNFTDTALHAFGTGVITMLIAGMVQMVAPVFARARMDGAPPGLVERSVWPLLWGATAARVAAALAGGYAFTALAALSGVLGWAGLAALAGLRGGEAEPPDGYIGLGADFGLIRRIHLMAAAYWFGGLVVLATVAVDGLAVER